MENLCLLAFPRECPHTFVMSPPWEAQKLATSICPHTTVLENRTLLTQLSTKFSNQCVQTEGIHPKTVQRAVVRLEPPLLCGESPAEGGLHIYTLSSFATRDNSSGNLWCGSCEPPLHGSGGCEQTSLGRQEQRQPAAGPQQAACGDGFHLRQMMAVCSSEKKKNPKQIKCMSPAILNLTSTLFIFPSGFIPL